MNYCVVLILVLVIGCAAYPAHSETVRATDDFNRADNVDLGANWTPTTGRPFSIVSQRAQPPDFAGGDDESYTGLTWAADQFSRAKLTMVGENNGSGMGVSVRGQPPDRTFYDCLANHGASSNVSISKFVTGAYTDLGQITQAWNDGDEFTIKVAGTNVTCYYGSTLILSSADSSITSGSPGIRHSATITSGFVDDWVGGEFDWQSIGSLGSTQSKTANQTSLALTTTAACEAANVCACVVAVDNNGTADGDEGAITSITDSASNAWTELIEFANGQGAAQTGAVVYLGYTKATSTIASSGTITANFSNSTSRDASAMTCWEFSVTSGYTVSIAGTPQGLATDGADPAAISLSSLTSAEYLFLHGLAGEGPNTDAYTWDTDYTQFAANGTTGGTDDDMHVRGGFRIFVGTGDTVDITSTTADRDYAQVMAALLASPAIANRRRLTVFGVGP